MLFVPGTRYEYQVQVFVPGTQVRNTGKYFPGCGSWYDGWFVEERVQHSSRIPEDIFFASMYALLLCACHHAFLCCLSAFFVMLTDCLVSKRKTPSSSSSSAAAPVGHVTSIDPIQSATNRACVRNDITTAPQQYLQYLQQAIRTQTCSGNPRGTAALCMYSSTYFCFLVSLFVEVAPLITTADQSCTVIISVSCCFVTTAYYNS